MHYAPKQSRFGENFAGLAVVVAMHLVFFYFLVNAVVGGVATITTPKPIDVVVIQDAPKPPEPVLDRALPQAPTVFSVPVIVDYPIVTIEPPATTANERPADTGVNNPIQTAAPSDGKALPVPVATVGIACPNSQRIREEMRYPAAARRDGIQGEVVVRFVVGVAGEIKNISVVNSAHRALSNAAVSAVKQFSCASQGRDVAVEVPFNFRLTD